MWFNKESLNSILSNYTIIFHNKKNFFLSNDINFWKKKFFYNLNDLKLIKENTLVLNDYQKFFKFQKKFESNTIENYLFYLKYHLFFNNLVLSNLNILVLEKNYNILVNNLRNSYLRLINLYILNLKLFNIKNFFLFDIFFYLNFIFFIDSYLLIVDRYINYIEYFKLFDLNFIVNFKFVLLKTFTSKELYNLWYFLQIPLNGSLVYNKMTDKWIKNKDIFDKTNLSFINSLELTLVYTYWKEFRYDKKIENNVLLNFIYVKFVMNNNKKKYINSKFFYLNKKKGVLNKKKFNIAVFNKKKFFEFLSYIKKRYSNTVVKRGVKFKDYNNIQKLTKVDSDYLCLIYYCYFFFYIKNLYNISIKYLYNIEFLYFFNSGWKENKCKIYFYIFIIFLKLVNKLKCKFKKGLFKLIFSLYFFLLKYKLNLNALKTVKLYYFKFSWTPLFKEKFFNLLMQNLELNINFIWNYRDDLLNKTIYYYYYNNWNKVYNDLQLKLNRKEKRFKFLLKGVSFSLLKTNLVFLKLYDLYRLGSYKFWSLFYKKKILKLKLLFLNLFFKQRSIQLNYKKIKKYVFLKLGNNFNFIFFISLFNRKNKKLHFNKCNLYNFNKLKKIYIYFFYLNYLLKKNFKLKKITFKGISFYYLMRDLNKSLYFHIKFLNKTLVYLYLNNVILKDFRLINLIVMKKNYKKLFYKNLYYFFNKKVKLINLKKVYIDRTFLFKLKLKKVITEKKKMNNYINITKLIGLKDDLLHLNHDSKINFNMNLNIYKKVFIQDMIYYFNDHFFFRDESVDLFLDSKLFFNNVDYEFFKFFKKQINTFDNKWWFTKIKLLNNKKKYYLFKFEVLQHIKTFSLFNGNLSSNMYLNYQMDEFFDNTFITLCHETKYKFNLDTVLLDKALAYIDNKELLKRKKFNLLQFKKLYIFLYKFNEIYENDVDLFIEDLDYFFFDYNLYNIDKKKNSNISFNYYSFIDKETMVYLRLDNKEYFQLHQIDINISFFFNILSYFFWINFKQINLYILELNRSLILWNRKLRNLLNEKNVYKKLLLSVNENYFELNNYFFKLNEKKKRYFINSVVNSNKIFIEKSFISSNSICTVCNCLQINKFNYKMVQYYQGLFDKGYKNLWKFNYKLCSICKFYVLNVCDEAVKFYDNSKYFINDWVNLNKKEGFIILDNSLIFIKILNDNSIIFRDLLLLNLKIENNLFMYLFFFFDLNSKLYKSSNNPYIWTKVAFSCISWDTSKFFNDNRYLSMSTVNLNYSLEANKKVLTNVLYNNWIPKRNFWRSLSKQQRLELKLNKQTEDLRKIGKKEV